MHTDPLLYRLFQERPAMAFELAGLPVADAADYRMRAIEVKQTAFRLDGVLLPPPDRPKVEGLSFDARLARLIILEAAQAPAEARALVAGPDPAADPLEILDLVETILVYKFPMLSREEIRAMLHLPETDLKKTRFYQEVFGEGRQEGRQEGVADILGRQIAVKFGPPDQAIRRRLETADTDTLLRWSERILNADSLDEIFGDPH